MRMSRRADIFAMLSVAQLKALTVFLPLGVLEGLECAAILLDVAVDLRIAVVFTIPFELLLNLLGIALFLSAPSLLVPCVLRLFQNHLLSSFLDQIAIQMELADEWIDLPQAQR